MADPRATYDRFDIQTWKVTLQEELRASGLPETIYKLNRDMVDSARVNALLSEADTVMRHLREMGNVYECVLLRYDLPSFD